MSLKMINPDMRLIKSPWESNQGQLMHNRSVYFQEFGMKISDFTNLIRYFVNRNKGVNSTAGVYLGPGWQL